MPKDKNGKNNSSEITIKETSSKLDISESTVRKYLKDFDLQIEHGSGSKAVISNETFQTLNEIVKLRANGLTIQEIKELKTQKPSKHILDEIEETEILPKSANDEIETKSEALLDSTKLDLDVSLTGDDSSVSDSEELSLDTDEQKEPSDTAQEEESEMPEALEGEEQPRRRRGFNFRYVERQISNDSKRVSSIRRRLSNPNISVQEKLFFEEALERRVLMLNGWKHILRWISKR